MNYLKIYCNLIRKAEKRNYNKTISKKLNIYVEGHHVFPVSIFGKNKRIVYLTAREHYIAHALLEKIYIKRYGESDLRARKMINAHIFMKSGKYFNSYLYEFTRKRFANYISEKMLGHEVNDVTRQKISIASKNRSKETLKKISESSKGRKHSEKTKQKMSNSHKGKKKPIGHGENVSRAKKGKPSPLKGKKLKESHKRKISDSHAKVFYFINPEGKLTKIKNLQKFCLENNLTRSYFYQLLKGKRQEYLGWKIP